VNRTAIRKEAHNRASRALDIARGRCQGGQEGEQRALHVRGGCKSCDPKGCDAVLAEQAHRPQQVQRVQGRDPEGLDDAALTEAGTHGFGTKPNRGHRG
jgi:hypothetical protein